MRESVGGSYLLYIIVFFIGVIILFFASILSYAKAYRVKNRIINIAENSACYPLDDSDDQLYNNIIMDVNSDLKDVGYTFSSTSDCNFEFGNISERDCANFNTSDHGVIGNKGGTYNYCICKVNVDESDPSLGYYFKVITFSQFEFPIIKDVIKTSVYGETKVMCKNYKDY